MASPDVFLPLEPSQALVRLLPSPGLQKSSGVPAAAGNGHSAHSAPSFEAVIQLVADSVSSPETRRSYTHALVEFTSWKAECGFPFTRAIVQAWRAKLEAEGLSAATVNLRLAAVRKLAREAAANGLLDDQTAAGIRDVPGVRQRGNRSGNWLTKAQAQALIEAPAPQTLKGRRDRCALALLVGCALRRSEAGNLTFEDIQQRDGRWVIVDLRGKGGRIRTVPVPAWVKVAVDRWSEAAQLTAGRVLRTLNRGAIGEALSDRAIWNIAASYGESLGLSLQAHDLRRTCAKLCRAAGGELEQIQLLLGHASVQTTERYLGTRQDLTHAPNDRLGLKWREE